MRPNTIARVISYYERSREYDQEVERAAAKFFGQSPTELSADELNEETERLFFEWFIYDFTLVSGRTPLMEYEFKNPDNLTELELRETLELGASRFGIWEVKAVRVGEGMDLLDPFSAESFAVKERLGTYELKRGDLICARVGKLSGQFELVGGLLNKLPLHLSESVRQSWRGQKPFITSPKQVWKMWYAPRDQEVKEQKSGLGAILEFKDDLKATRESFSEALKLNQLDEMVSTNTVERWINSRRPIEKELAPLTMLTGLLPEKMSKKNIEALINAYHALANALPRRALGGVSPNEKAKRSKQRFGKSGVILHQTKIPPEGGFGKIAEAHAAMEKAELISAVRLFNEAFALYQKENTTFREVYRFYANAATAYFACGDAAGGGTLLEIALKLNPNYDFARDLNKRYKKGELLEMIWRGKSGLLGQRRPWRKITASSAFKYYEFLKERKINFATKEKTDSVRTYWSATPGRPIGRNEPCPCGAKTREGRQIKYKRCHGKNI